MYNNGATLSYYHSLLEEQLLCCQNRRVHICNWINVTIGYMYISRWNERDGKGYTFHYLDINYSRNIS